MAEHEIHKFDKVEGSGLVLVLSCNRENFARRDFRNFEEVSSDAQLWYEEMMTEHMKECGKEPNENDASES